MLIVSWKPISLRFSPSQLPFGPYANELPFLGIQSWLLI